VLARLARGLEHEHDEEGDATEGKDLMPDARRADARFPVRSSA
jgi:hypothetical protein